MVFWLYLWLFFGFVFLFMQLRKLDSFRSQHRFPQPAQDSAAILLKVVLQVSYEETSYMGKLQMAGTWNVSLRIGQIIHEKPRSTKVKDVANQRVQRWYVTLKGTWMICGLVPSSRRLQRTWGLFLNNESNSQPLRRFKKHNDSYTRSRLKRSTCLWHAVNSIVVD